MHKSSDCYETHLPWALSRVGSSHCCRRCPPSSTRFPLFFRNAAFYCFPTLRKRNSDRSKQRIKQRCIGWRLWNQTNVRLNNQTHLNGEFPYCAGSFASVRLNAVQWNVCLIGWKCVTWHKEMPRRDTKRRQKISNGHTKRVLVSFPLFLSLSLSLELLASVCSVLARV